MALTSHIFLGVRWVYKGLLVAAPVAGGLLGLAAFHRGLPPAAERPAVPALPPLSWPAAAPGMPPACLAALQGPAAASAANHQAAFLADFRFHGAFFLYGGPQSQATLRRGVISFLPDRSQEIVSVGSRFAGALVKAIEEDRLVLEKDGVQGVLRLGNAAGLPSRRSFLDDAPPPRIRQTRFGEQTGNDLWTMKKSAMMDYYAELLDAPERLLQVFDSMRPLYGQDGQSIEGYQLQTVGEAEFFEAVGLQQGDVVRRVNAVPMTNRGRAEFFIKQVVEDRVSAIVIDLEREGAKKRLVYQLR